MKNITKEELLTTYKVLGELMKYNDLTMDNSFIRVRNKIANMVMDILIKEQNNG